FGVSNSAVAMGDGGPSLRFERNCVSVTGTKTIFLSPILLRRSLPSSKRIRTIPNRRSRKRVTSVRVESGWYQPAYAAALAGKVATGGGVGFCRLRVMYARMVLPIFSNAPPFAALML